MSPRASAPIRRAPETEAVIVTDRPIAATIGIPTNGNAMLSTNNVMPNFKRQFEAGCSDVIACSFTTFPPVKYTQVLDWYKVSPKNYSNIVNFLINQYRIRCTSIKRAYNSREWLLGDFS